VARLRTLLVVALCALVPAVAGCLEGAFSARATPAAALPPAGPWYEAALAHGAGHDHQDLSQHRNASTPNFVKLGHDPLLSPHYGGQPSGAYGCGDSATRADGRRLTVVASFLDDMAFELVDVTDAARPQRVGEFYSQGIGSWDAAITRDGHFVVLALDSLARVPSAPGIAFQRACDGATMRLALPDAAVTTGIMMIDVRDPTSPVYADYDPMPGYNTHSVSTAEMDGLQVVIGSMVSLAHPASYFVFDTVLETPLGGKLVRLSTFDSPPLATSTSLTGARPLVAPLTNGHVDATLERNPADGMEYAYLADWDGGVVILDMTVPVAPVMVAQWIPPAANAGGELIDLLNGDCYPGAIHTVLPAPGLWEGRHVLFAGQECPMKTSTHAPGGSVFVLDITNPALLSEIGEWHLPEDTGVWTTEYQASPHYVALVNRTLLVSDYHAGLWAVDVGPSKLASPPSIGVFLPDEAPPVAPHAGRGTPAPFDEQVDAFADGTIVLNDDLSGLYTLKFDASNPMPEAAPFAYS
jgi:hypothetical protein